MPLRIPRILHRIWLGPPMPPEFEAYGARWQELNPDWEVRLWTEADLPRLANQDVYDRAGSLTTSALAWRMRSDIARYELLHAHGGLYVDTDFEPLKPIEPLIDDMLVFAGEERRGLVANGFLGAVKGSPFIKQLIDDLPASVAQRPGQPPWRTTGPEFLTRVAKQRPGELSLVPTAAIYPYHHTQLRRHGTPPPIPSTAYAHHVWASVRQSVSVIIPWRPGCPHREAARTWLGARLRADHPEWQVVDADCTDDAWNKAEAIITGAEQSFGDILVIHDADVWCDNLDEAVKAVRDGATWAMPYQHLHRLSPDASSDVLEGRAELADVMDRLAEPVYRGVDGGGLLVLKRSTLEKVPPDKRFRGWGGEDEAWAWALSTVAGAMWRGNGRLAHFWHPPQARQTRSRGSDENYALWQQYRAARGNRDLMLEVMGLAPARRKPVIYKHLRTNRQRMVKTGTPEQLALEADARWIKVSDSP